MNWLQLKELGGGRHGPVFRPNALSVSNESGRMPRDLDDHGGAGCTPIMYYSGETIDDLLEPVMRRLLRSRNVVQASRGKTHEMTGVLLRLRNPRSRLSHTEAKGHVFSPLGELLWYLAGSDRLDFIAYYIAKYKDESEDGKTIYGAYGPRFFSREGKGQISNIIHVLKHGPSTRRAVIRLFDAKDIVARKTEVPCTCTLQFLLRRGRLHLVTYMRSNDAFRGLPHDVFTFTMLQEIVARSVDADVGDYKHAVGSLHLYEDNFADAAKYLKEGFQPRNRPMPAMPAGDPWPHVKVLLQVEAAIRQGKRIPKGASGLPPYWADLGRLLEVYRLSKTHERSQVRGIRRQMSSRIYDSYIMRRELPISAPAQPEQMPLPFAAEVRANIGLGGG